MLKAAGDFAAIRHQDLFSERSVSTSSQRGTMLHRKSQTTPLPSKQFVTPSVFENRLTSRARLTRRDDHEANAIGLFDEDTGEHILVSLEDWLKHNRNSREAVSA